MRNLMRCLANLGLAVDHPALDLDSAAHGIHDTRKFREHAVAGVFDDPPLMLTDLWVDQFDEMRLEALVRALLIGAHQARIACHVGREDRGEMAGSGCGGHCLGGASLVHAPNLTYFERERAKFVRPRSLEAERRHPVGPNELILRADYHPLEVRLGDNQPIERIVMVTRQRAGMLGMSARHRQNLEAERQHGSDDRSIEAKLPDRSLDGNFPYCRRADDDLVRAVAHCCEQRRRDQTGPLIRPKQDMRVDQQPHGCYSKYFCNSGGRGASKSSAI